ncbi:hypothetical protein F5B22DRAFT_643574 [Xylaria bambusicola]|uniref:uncharacterized protein n=1 Tax=Xylaria bambusicola TaxID=326684 RepID=UPI002007A989|nr:uncharacterized protein F5B22DRAFT_643574 [Xylaria bambusicola]KAI0521993.1 hypothetical protein F5B22DRAFT_643574 [Xylaria bambusicola]
MSTDSYDSGYDHGYFQTPPHVIAAGIGLPTLNIVSIFLRFLARKKQKQPLKADDWLLVPATLLNLGIGISMVYGVSKNALAYPYVPPLESGEDIFSSHSEQMSIEGAIQWAYTFLLPLALGCTKMSFLLLYRRIFATNRLGKTNIFLIGMCVIIFLWMWGFFFVFLFICRLNFWALWATARAVFDHCIRDTGPNFAVIISDVITDVVIIVTPIPLIWRLNLTLGRKIGITAVFLFGLITFAASLTRLVLTSRILGVGHGLNADPILLATSFIYWGMVETGIAVFVACLPTLWIFGTRSTLTALLSAVKSITNFSITNISLFRTRTINDDIDAGLKTSLEVEGHSSAGGQSPNPSKYSENTT